MTDADLAKCFPRTSGAWKREAEFYQMFRFSCDRIVGHAAPSRWTETKTDDAIKNKIESPSKCSGASSDQGMPLRAEKCTEAVKSFTKSYFSFNTSLLIYTILEALISFGDITIGFDICKESPPDVAVSKELLPAVK